MLIDSLVFKVSNIGLIFCIEIEVYYIKRRVMLFLEFIDIYNMFFTLISMLFI